MPQTSSTSTIPIEETQMKLTDVSYDRIRAANMLELYDLSVIAGIHDDERLVNSEDLRERLILLKRKMEGSHHTWKHLFQSVQEETKVKSESLLDLMRTVEATFKMCHVKSLSEILRKEGHLQSRDLLQELSKRAKNLQEQRSLVIIAGETNGGKSTFLNLLLGEDILPTDVLHCTIAVCKIVYSETYCLKAVYHNDQAEIFPNLSREELKSLLKNKAAEWKIIKRADGSPIKEITLGLPADILKSGVTLVDTPGIGEDENMDNVTMNFVKSTHASAFIYIIKSDTAGGVQEDRLLSFLRAIKERYSSDAEVESFDPRAAMFVCHRWDNIEVQQRDKVKKNALSKLEYVWPGFEPSQTFFFSTVDTMKHFPVDPDFITDSFMLLLKGLKQLFERASHNAVKHQYIWLKYLLQPASRYLRSMITHCIHNNDELEMYFTNVAIKQNKLKASSKENSDKLQNELNTLSMDLHDKIIDYLSLHHGIPACKEIITTCSEENFLYSKTNRQMLDEMIIRCLLKYVDEHVNERKFVTEMESTILAAIQDHLGLFQSQISHIKNAMQNGGNMSLTPSPSRTSLDKEDFGLKLSSSTASTNSLRSEGSLIEDFSSERALDISRLASTINGLLLRRKGGQSGRSIHSKHEIQESLLSKVMSRIMIGFFHKVDAATYVEERIWKIARHLQEDQMTMDSIVKGYTQWIQECVTYATNSIPKFIEVNNQLIDEIREHRSVFQKNKDTLRKVMEELEPIRHHLKGYGLLYMDDINAEMLSFNVEERNSIVNLYDLVADHEVGVGGFEGSGSKRRKVQSLWAQMKCAKIKINDMQERVVVKTYLYDMDEKVVLSEIATLRCLEHINLAPFIGMTRILATGSSRDNNEISENPTEKVSAFIFKGNLVSVNVYSKKRMTNMQLFVPQFVHSLLEGLNYIHRENLVHMEMNLDTVMVELGSGTVKLCHMCKPRTAKFPSNPNTITRSCVCLSPPVLQGHKYESTDDLYAFGLLLWELLFPDNPPYREQRVWLLTKFMKECHPNNMLQETIPKLNVSESVCEVLRGTLLVSGRQICLPIARVQSLLKDIADEPAIISLRSRNKQLPIRERVPIVADSGKTPRRPPRKTDKVISSESKEPEIIIDEKWFPSKKSRRSTMPAFQPPPSSNKLTKIISVLFGRGFKIKADEEIDESEERVSAYLKKDRRKSTTVLDEVDSKQQATDVEFSTPQVKPQITPRNLRKQSTGDAKTHHRRLSLQETQSNFSHKSEGSFGEDDFDVPSIMSKYSPNWGNTFPKDKEHFEKFLPTSQSDSVLLTSWSSSKDAQFYINQRPSSAASSIVTRETGYADRQADGSVTLNKTKRDTAISKSESAFRAIEEDKLGAKRIQAEHVSHLVVGQRLGNSLQNISEVDHTMDPILEDNVYTSGSQSINNSGNSYINHHFKRNIGHSRWSPPTVPRLKKKHLLGASSLVSSSKSVGPGIDGLHTDLRLKNMASFDGINIKLRPDSKTYSKLVNNNFEKQNDIEHFSVTQNLNPDAANSNFNEAKSFIKSDGQSDVTLENNSLDDSKTIADSFNNNSRKSVHFYFEGTINDSSMDSDQCCDSLSPSASVDSGKYYYSPSSSASLDSEVYVNSRTSDIPNPMLVPPPPPINFSKLTFGKDYSDYSDSD